MEQKQISARTALQMIIGELSAIEVPVVMLEKIGLPLARSINNLKVLVDVVPDDEPAADKKEEPEIEIALGDENGQEINN